MEALTKQLISVFGSILSPVSYKKGAVVQEGNSLGDSLFIVQSGLLRSYYFQNGTDITAHFAVPFGIVGAVDSILKQQRSIYWIEALQCSEVLQLNYGQMEAFLEDNPEYERVARQVLQMLYLDLVERFEGLMFLNAQERYMHFCRRYPDLIQNASLGHIASYLGMTQETLSRVRRSK